MKNFVVLYKPIEIPLNFSTSNKLQGYLVQMDFFLSEVGKEINEIGKWADIKNNYEIDPKTATVQPVNGRLCVTMIAFQK